MKTRNLLIALALLALANIQASFGQPIPPGGGNTNSSGGGNTNYFQGPMFGSNDFWLQPLALGANTNSLTFILHATTNDGQTIYTVVSETNLDCNCWGTETSILGAVGQNWTPGTISLAGRPGLFLKAFNATQDSDGNGLPDWWQLKYFGHLGVDPLASPAGDGWNNLEKYQNGMNPTTFYTPPAPQITQATLNSDGTAVTLSWFPAGGTVTQYAVEDIGYSTNYVSANTLTFSVGDSFPYGDTPYAEPTYQVEALYANGVTSASQQVQVGSYGPALAINLFRGPSAKLYFAVQSIPPNLAKIRILWSTNVFDDTMNYLDLSPTNLVNGIAPIPTDQGGYSEGAYAYQFYYTDGTFSRVKYAYVYRADEEDYPGVNSETNFVSEAAQMKANLQFLLRSATVTEPFSYAANIDSLNQGRDYLSSSELQSPDQWYARPPSSTNYEYYGFHVFSPGINYSILDDLRPVRENFLWYNFVYNLTNYDESGILTNGVSSDYTYGNYEGPDRFLNAPTYQYFGSGSESPLPQPLTTNNSLWLYRSSLSDLTVGLSDEPAEDWPPAHEFGLYLNFTNMVLPYVRNCYGLPLDALGYGTSSVWGVGTAIRYFADDVPAFMDFETPKLKTVDYYFASQTAYLWHGGNVPPVPGSPTFSVTNVSPPMIVGFYQPFGALITVAGWAKQQITNGYSDKYAYLEQYFDKAYQIDANGSVTANEAGLISPYGEFFPSIAGPAAVVTMPDIDTGQRGTGVVNVIKLQLDVNHDGAMDLTYAGPDNTQPSSPYVFWVNNDYDRPFFDADDNTNYEDSVLTGDCPYTHGTPTADNNYRDASGYRVIPTKRDLEDFSRLWVAGITPSLRAALPPGSTIMLSWGDEGSPNPNNPVIDLFMAADGDGGIGYLTNETIAIAQTNSATYPCIGRLGPGGSIQLNAATFANNWAGDHLIWCGAAPGNGALTLTITDPSGIVLGQTVSYIKVMDIKQMYERWTVGDNPTNAPVAAAYLSPDDLPAGTLVNPAKPFQYLYNPLTDANLPYILYVHGWNMAPSDKDHFAETAFKRLYWQGYQGRFGVFRWPTRYGFRGTLDQLFSDRTQKDNYDDSEFIAWRAANGLLNKLEDLNAQYPGHIYLLAHSMGNIVAGEALRLAGSQVVNTYVASQAALSAHAYDTNVPDFSFDITIGGISKNFGPVTPNIYGGWFVGNNGGGTGKIINFYNTNDFALARTHWQLDQLTKPDQNVLEGATTWSYGYTGTPNDPPPWAFWKQQVNSANVVFFNVLNLNDRYETSAYAAQAYATALGATPVSLLFVTRDVDLTRTSPSTIWPSPDPLGNNYGSHFYHSAEFRADNAQQQSYWSELLSAEAFNLR